MPLPKNLEELLKHMAPEAAVAQRKLWEDNPAIAAEVDKYTVPQAEFSRQLNAKDAEVRTAKENEAKIREWEKKNRPEFDRAVTDLARVTKENEELRAKAARIATHEGDLNDTTVNPEQLMERVLAKIGERTVTPEKMTELLTAEASKMSEQIKSTLDTERKNFFEKTVPQGLAWQADMLEVMQDHLQEFGKKMDRAAFSTFMTENGLTDPKAAYERFAAPTRQEKTIQAEVDKRVKDAMSKMNVPGVTPGDQFGSGEKGFLQLRIEGEKSPVVYPEGSELGDRSAANLAAKELRSEGTY